MTHQHPDRSLAVYLGDASEVPLLSPAEEIALAARIKAGDEEARERMILANLRLVVKIAMDYQHVSLPLLDLINEGNIGLMRAVDLFDPSKGAKLSTYAALWIKQRIRRALDDYSRTIRLPSHVASGVRAIQNLEAQFREEVGRDPSNSELAEASGMTVRKVAKMLAVGMREVSLDSPVGDDGDGATIAEHLADPNAEDPAESLQENTRRAMAVRLLDKLSEREAQILRRRFGIDCESETLEVIGMDLGVTRERIRQLEAGALETLGMLARYEERIGKAKEPVVPRTRKWRKAA